MSSIIPAAAFATHAHESRSDRYGFIPTSVVLDALQREGFEVAKSFTQRVRDNSKVGFERHQLRLRPAGFRASEAALGTLIPEIILTNSHDGSSGFRLDAGLHRLVCNNGLTVAQGAQSAVSVPHRGTAERLVGRVIEGTYEVLDEANRGIVAAREWSQIELHRSEQEALAEAAIAARWGVDEQGNVQSPVSLGAVLSPRRFDDAAPNLWNVYNRLQEAIVEKGGTRGRARTGRRLTTRPVTGINEASNLNRALWLLASRMADVKTGKIDLSVPA